MSSKSLRPLLVFGTRPEAIKMSPLVLAAKERSDFAPIVCSTGQHREMLQQVIDYFGIVPDLTLDVMRPNQTLAGLTSRLLEGLDRAIEERQPDCVVAQGDTTSVMAAAIVAFYRRLPLVHVEAGLRTGNLYAPWPEEFNRRVAGITATLHCSPTAASADNLRRESIPHQDIRITGNTVIDALLWTAAREGKSNRFVESYPYLQGGQRMVLITGHRRENFGSGFENICRAIANLAQRHNDVSFIYPVHLNPNVQGPVRSILASYANVHLTAPASYPEFVWLMERSHMILTDSGGVQEEAPSLGKPVLVMRETTERPEAVTAGASALVGTDVDKITAGVSQLLEDPAAYRRMQVKVNPYGDGQASHRILDWMVERLSGKAD